MPLSARTGGFKSRMKKRLTRFVLVIAISFFVPLPSAYLDYHDLGEADFFARDICFENPDQENLLMDQHHKSNALLSAAFSNRLPPFIEVSEQSPLFSLSACSLDQKTFILRC
jgi:hypothetical protein